MKILALSLCLLATTAELVPAQVVSFGVKGGFPMLNAAATDDESPPYMVGASVEFRLPANWALETDAFYRRVGDSAPTLFTANGLTIPTDRIRGNSWQFPAILKHYFGDRERKIQPFLGAGFDFRATHYVVEGTGVAYAAGTTVSYPSRYTFLAETGIGPAFSVGVRMHAGRFAVIPEVRYVRWGFSDGILKNDEADFILGLNF